MPIGADTGTLRETAEIRLSVDRPHERQPDSDLKLRRVQSEERNRTEPASTPAHQIAKAV